MNRFELYKDYHYPVIELAIEKHRHTFNQLDFGFNIGGDFLMLEEETTGKRVSFVLTGMQGEVYVYTCIYTDFNTSNPIKKLEEANRSLMIDLEHTQSLLTDALNKG